MSDGLSPGMRQYLAAKRQHPDALLLCRMGDFYETFGADAETVARELDIVLTSRGTDAEGNRIPLAGVPYHAAESYIARLVRKGYRVAIAEQMEDPKKAKGLVKREVVRVVTPGTLVDGAMLEAPQARYLMAVAPGPERTGIAVLDASTGEFTALAVPNDEARAAVLAEAVRHSPEEVLIPETLDGPVLEAVASLEAVPTRRPASAFESGAAARYLAGRFGRSFESDDPAAVAAAGAALAYAEAMHHAPLPQVGGLSLAASRRGPARPRRDHGPEPRAGPAGPRRQEGRDPARGPRPDGHVHGRPPPPRPDRPAARDPAAINRRLDAVEFFAKSTVARRDLRRRLGARRRPRADRRPHRLRQRLAARPRRAPAVARGPARSGGPPRVGRRRPRAPRRGRRRARRPRR